MPRRVLELVPLLPPGGSPPHAGEAARVRLVLGKNSIDARLDQWSRDALQWMNTGRRSVYHGTNAIFADQIREEGLHQRNGGIFVSRDWRIARWYAAQRSSHAHIAHGKPWLGAVLEIDVDSRYLKRTPPTDDFDEEEFVVTAPVSPAAIVGTETIDWGYPLEVAELLDAWLVFDRARCPICRGSDDGESLAEADTLDTLPGPRPSPEAEELLRAVMPYATTFARGSGQHGPPHWRRAALLGEELAAATPGADVDVARRFAVLHDSQRQTDDRDPEHGPRAARRAGEVFPELAPDRLALLEFACERHAEGQVTPDATTGCAWDCDRLDLWRTAVEPEVGRLSTAAARRPEMIRRAWALNGRPRLLREIERRLAELDLRGVRDVVRRVAPDERLFDRLP